LFYLIVIGNFTLRVLWKINSTKIRLRVYYCFFHWLSKEFFPFNSKCKQNWENEWLENWLPWKWVEKLTSGIEVVFERKMFLQIFFKVNFFISRLWLWFCRCCLLKSRNVISDDLDDPDRERDRFDVLQSVGNVVQESTERGSDVFSDFVESVSVGKVSGPDRNVAKKYFVDEHLNLIFVIRCDNIGRQKILKKKFFNYYVLFFVVSKDYIRTIVRNMIDRNYFPLFTWLFKKQINLIILSKSILSNHDKNGNLTIYFFKLKVF
jgi:hypothetical protein